jgi:hypothetical protein
MQLTLARGVTGILCPNPLGERTFATLPERAFGIKPKLERMFLIWGAGGPTL